MDEKAIPTSSKLSSWVLDVGYVTSFVLSVGCVYDTGGLTQGGPGPEGIRLGSKFGGLKIENFDFRGNFV